MTKAELIEKIARSRDLPPDMTKKDIATILGVAFDELATYFAKARVTRASSPRFTFPRFGTFTKKKKKARRGVNPRTLEPIQIEACCTVDFKASRELRESMNSPAAAQRKSAPAKKKRATKKTQKRNRTAAKGSGKRPDAAGPSGRRRLTPRDEEAELDAMIDDKALFDELPPAPMQRVPKSGRSRRSDSRARTG